MKVRDLNRVVVAFAKGRLAEKSVEILEAVGVKCKDILKPSRKLVFNLEDSNFSFLFVKPTDVPIYVERGIADIGICGRDTLLEQNKEVYELLDLNFSKCDICLAGYKGTVIDKRATNLKVATKYDNIARRLFHERGQNVEIIKLYGSIELAPILGLSDVILDVVESGRTLKENNLVVLEELYKSSARLIANKVSFKIKSEVLELKEKIEKYLEDKCE